jgi:L-threonylcarbamoyladenylate synthase
MTVRWPADPSHVAQAADRLRAGAVIAFPTDTLYAIGARALDRAAVQRLYDVKRRPLSQPLVWLVINQAQVEGFAMVSEAAAILMRRFWPGPLTLVLPARQGVELATMAVRAPAHEVALALLHDLGEPIASSSANAAGRPPPVDAAQVVEGLGDALDVVLDGGSCPVGEPSTILDLSGAAPRILRQGAVPAAELVTP